MFKRCLALFVLFFIPVYLIGAPKDFPTVDDYKQALSQYSLWAKNIANNDFYKDLEFTNNKTKKKFTIKDLSSLEKKLFFLWQSEILSSNLARLQQLWEKETPLDRENLTEEQLADPKRIADKTDVKEYLEKLLAVRKTHAKRFEELAKKTFEKYKYNIPKKEREFYIQKIQKWNDSHKLIDRKKE